MINLSISGNSIIFEFQDNQHYLNNGTIEVPVNSLTLVTDESNMATFKKSASNDIFLSCLYSELGMTKAELETFYKENMVGGGVDPADVLDIVESATSYYDGVEYDSVNSRINFKHGNTIEGYIDAAPFIADGMVDNVAIVNGNLVITFNTDSGKQPISIPLTDIFDPNNYYDKTAIDTIISGITDDIIDDEEVISSALNDLNERKLDASAYTPTDLSNYYTKSETSGATEISAALNDKLTDVSTGTASYAGSGVTDIKISKNGSSYTTRTYVASINNKPILAGSDYTNVNKFSLVETSAITSSVTSASTDTEIPTAKAVYDALGQGGGGSASSAITSGDTNAVQGGAVYDKFDEVESVTAAALNNLNNKFGGLSLVKLTQAEYDALTTKDNNTLYVIVD